MCGCVSNGIDVLRVECTKCERKGRYNVARLIEKHGRRGDLKADCPRRDAHSLHERYDVLCPRGSVAAILAHDHSMGQEKETRLAGGKLRAGFCWPPVGASVLLWPAKLNAHTERVRHTEHFLGPGAQGVQNHERGNRKRDRDKVHAHRATSPD
jgi:hypothetical protein